MLKLNMKCCDSIVVDEKFTEKALGCGNLSILATPSIIALIEKTAIKIIEKQLPKGMGTIGKSINIERVNAILPDMIIYCECVLSEINENCLVFNVRVYDDFELVGKGTYKRAIVNNFKYISKAQDKRWS